MDRSGNDREDDLSSFSFFIDTEFLLTYKDYLENKKQEEDVMDHLKKLKFMCIDEIHVYLYVNQMMLFLKEALENLNSDETLNIVKNIIKNGYGSLCDDFCFTQTRTPDFRRILYDFNLNKNGSQSDESSNKKLAIKFVTSSSINKLKPDKRILNLNPQIIKIGMNSNGKLNIYTRIHILNSYLNSLNLDAQLENIFSTFSSMEKELLKQIDLANDIQINQAKFNQYIEIFVNQRDKVTETLRSLRKSLNLFLNLNSQSSLKFLETLYIKLLGHLEKEVRNESVICLNMIYDNTNWQEKSPFNCSIKNLGDKIIVDVNIRKKDINEACENLVLITNVPGIGIKWIANKKIIECKENTLKLVYDLGQFERCGYYDWNLVKFKDGNFSTIKCIQDIKFPSDMKEAKGRFIVINKQVRDLSVHEIFCDLLNAEIDTKGNLVKRGSFTDLESKLEEYSQRYINCLYLMGVLERDNQIAYDENTGEVLDIADPLSSPMAITCRASISSLLGGVEGFNKLMEKAKKYSIKILIDMLTRVSSSRFHRKYRNILLHTIDEKGKVNICYGTDGHSVSYDDTAMLNYRKIESWDLILNDILELARKHKIDGVHLDNCQSWPQILEIDRDEMMRVDCDGSPAYSALEILNGEVVIRNEDCGYWGSDLYDQYPNPFLIKITKKVWEEFPEFIFVGECWGSQKFNNRHLMLVRSGIVPRMYSLPRALSSVFGRKIHRNGYIELCKSAPVSIFKDYITENNRFLPEGSVLIQSSCGQVWPYPALLYGRGNWSAVDLLFALNDIPMTFMEEINGEAYRVQITNVYQQKEIPKQYISSRSSKSKSTTRLSLIEQRIDYEENYQNNQASRSSTDISGYDESRSPPKIKSLVSLSSINIKDVKELQAKQASIVREVGPEFGFDLNKIKFHYDHRRKLRSVHECFRRGELIFLNVLDSQNEPHPHVLAFARHCPEETGIIAINFASIVSNFKLDLKPLLPLFECEVNFNSACYIEDWISEENGDFYFIREVINEGLDRTLNVSFNLKTPYILKFYN